MNLFDEERIETAVKRIRKFCELAKKHGDLARLAFSGGKDSICVYGLAKMAGCEYDVYMSITTLEPKGHIPWIRKNYPEVRMEKHGGKIRNFYQGIESKGLPWFNRRWCCQVFKETKKYKYVITGVRAQESTRRLKTNKTELKVYNNRETRFFNSFEEIDSEITSGCMSGKSDRIILSPIYDWSEGEVWEFIRKQGLPYPSVYDNGTKRIGCMMCPMQTIKNRQKEARENPAVFRAVIRSYKKYLAKAKSIELKDDSFIKMYIGDMEVE